MLSSAITARQPYLQLHLAMLLGNTQRMASILSIHSAVTAGFVGNTIAGPVLTTHGHHPHLINSIMLAAHPGYGVHAGSLTAPEDLRAMLAALDTLDLMAGFKMIITGYIGNAHQIDPIATALKNWRTTCPGGSYVLDPVLGDAGRLYVDAAIAERMQTLLLPQADVITPNQFELSYLASLSVDDRASATIAANTILHQHDRLNAIIATGIADGPNERGDLLIERGQDPIWCPARADAKNVSGGGDLLTMLVTSYLASGESYRAAVPKACGITQKILAASDTSRELNLLENIALLSAD